MCGCPPARTHIVVAGRVRSAPDAPVAGARIEFSAVPVSRGALGVSDVSLSRAPVITDSLGGFHARVFSAWSPEPHVLKLRVIRAALRDTITVNVGTLRLVPERDRPDSTFISVNIP